MLMKLSKSCIVISTFQLEIDSLIYLCAASLIFVFKQQKTLHIKIIHTMKFLPLRSLKNSSLCFGFVLCKKTGLHDI